MLMTDFAQPERIPTAWEQEYLHDPRDDALAMVTLDGTEIAVCERCERVLCSCCEWCGKPACVCGPPISQREFRALAAKHDLGPARVRPR